MCYSITVHGVLGSNFRNVCPSSWYGASSTSHVSKSWMIINIAIRNGTELLIQARHLSIAVHQHLSRSRMDSGWNILTVTDLGILTKTLEISKAASWMEPHATK